MRSAGSITSPTTTDRLQPARILPITATWAIGTIIEQGDANGVTLSETLDAFGRIADMNWLNTATSTSADHLQLQLRSPTAMSYTRTIW